MKARKIYKKEFLKLSRELHKEFSKIGVKFNMHYRPLSFSAIQNGAHPRYDCVYGGYWHKEKKASVTARGKVTRWKILHVMAHELRHAQHDATGLFKDYYSKKPKSKQVAWRAERNCDAWALKWLRSRGIKVSEEKLRSGAYRDGGYKYFTPYWMGR